jgi:photosystem II stability/assembly factor-like uncharacterized protein
MRMAILACALAATSALGCSDDEKNPPPPPTSTQKPPTQAWKAAVGDGGTLLETFDDASWDVRKISDRDLYAVSCIDNEVGWAVGAHGAILHTRDGGWSWPAQSSGVTSTLRAVSFAFAEDGAQIGIAVGDAGTLLTTADGGAHWAQSELGELVGTLRGTAATEGAGLLLAVGDGGLVARSTDRGRSFGRYRIDGAGDLFDVALDASGGLAVAVDSAGSIWVSRDAAQSFARELQVSGKLESVSLGRTGALASAAGGGLALLRGPDGQWASITLPAEQALHATLVGPREDRVYFAGDEGALLETVDGGASMFQVEAATRASLRGIEDLQAR